MKTFAILVVSAVAVPAAVRAQGPQSDLLVENTGPAQAEPGSEVAFSVSITNLGPDPAASVVFDDALPAGMTFVSLAVPVGWSCTTPAVGSGGNIRCTLLELPASPTPVAFALLARIDPGAAAGAFFTSIASAASATFDPTSENDASTAVVQTPPPPASDLRVTLVGPSGSAPDRDVRYTIELANGGPDAASNVSLLQTVPGDLAFVSFTQLSGATASCSSGAAGVTCTLASMPADAVLSFALVAHVPPATADGTQYQAFATVGADFDPNGENDEHTSSLCVQADGCAAGACNGDVAVVCPTPDQCHDQASCDPATGLCPENPPKADGSDCDDGDACTRQDGCSSGACVAGDPVVCPPAGSCQLQGTCDPGTGLCNGNSPALDGSACDDANACTASSSCQAGSCSGSVTVACPLAQQCEVQGACNPLTGGCAANAPKFDGTGCDDGDWCTVDDTCQSGACTGSTRNCDDDDACTEDHCDPAGDCVHVELCDAGAGDAAVTPPDASEPLAGSNARDDAGAGTGGTGGRGDRDAGKPDAGNPRFGDSGAIDDGDEDAAAGSSDCSCGIGPGRDRPARDAWPLALLLAASSLARFTRRTRRPRRR
jgi:uncharacterized repeat protein (TIGR01451 family)